MTSLPERFNFAEHLFDLNRAHTERTAYIDDRGRLSYGDLEDRARRLASVLAEAGGRREERVLLLMHDTSDWPVCFLGCLYAGVVPVAVNTLLTADDYAYMLAHSRARTTRASGFIRRALRASPRARCTPTATCGGRPSCMASRCSASPSRTSVSQPQSCTSHTAWAMRSPSRCPWAPPWC